MQLSVIEKCPLFKKTRILHSVIRYCPRRRSWPDLLKARQIGKKQILILK